MHDLIRNYRESRNVMLDMEQKLILKDAPNKLYDSLPAIHKLEVCEITVRQGGATFKIIFAGVRKCAEVH